MTTPSVLTTVNYGNNSFCRFTHRRMTRRCIFMKAMHFLFLGWFLCMGGVSFAQEWQGILQKTAAKAARSHAGPRSEQLLRQVEKSLQKNKHAWLHRAYQEQADLVEDFMGKDCGPWLAGWVRQSNRLAISRRLFKEKISRRLLQRKQPVLENTLNLPLGRAADWAKQIPSQANIIFIGEYHLPKVQIQAASLLKAYQQMYPNRQVILLTEFASDSYPRFLSVREKEENAYLEKFFSLFPKRSIKTAGLEEKACMNTQVTNFSGTHISSSVLGVAVRNAHWLKRIYKWRAQYPDAVFFVYTGGGHCMLDELFSLARHFSPQESFVISFLVAGYKQEVSQQEMFHAFTDWRFYKPGVLLWKNRLKGRYAGFDMQIILKK